MLFDSSTPDAFWLDVTNAGLGVFCLACIVAIGWAIVQDVREKRHARVTEHSRSDYHVLDSPEFGLTMADGGQPLEPTSTNHEKPRRDRGKA